MLTRGLGNGVLSAADRVAGSFTGAAQALLIVWLAGGLLAIGPVRSLTEAAQTSTAIRSLNAFLPPPIELADELGTLLDGSVVPDFFVGFDPLPRPSVERPTDATARAIAELASASTFRINAATCGFESSGSGVAVAERYVVTNAHVVAGASARRRACRQLRRRPGRCCRRAVRPGARRGGPVRAGPPGPAVAVRASGPGTRCGSARPLATRAVAG